MPSFDDIDWSDKTIHKERCPRNGKPFYWSYRGHFDDGVVDGLTRQEILYVNANCLVDLLYNDWWGGRFNTLDTKKGWTLLAIAGALGNFDVECSLNPGLIERKYVDPDTGGGMSLAQWTPNKRFRNWCDSVNLPYHTMDTACYMMAAEMSGKRPMVEAEWLQYWPYTFYEYSQKNDASPGRMGLIFGQNYERPGAGIYTEREKKAEKWYEWLVQQTWTKHAPGGEFADQSLGKIMFYLRRRRDLYG